MSEKMSLSMSKKVSNTFKMSLFCTNCDQEIRKLRKSRLCETCYRVYELGYQTGYNAKRKERLQKQVSKGL